MTRWIIHTDSEVSGFSLVPIPDDKQYDFSNPTTYPIALALPIVFTDATEGARCLQALERLVGRLTMAGKIAPTTVNNYYPQPDASAIAEQVRLAILRTQEGPRRPRYEPAKSPVVAPEPQEAVTRFSAQVDEYATQADRLAQAQERIIRTQNAGGGVFNLNDPTELRI